MAGKLYVYPGIRCLDKLVDELAKGKTVEKILAKLESAGGK